MQTARTTKNRGWWLLIGLLLCLFYLAFAFYDGPHRYNDSGGYMAMDVSREPMYPLYLALTVWCIAKKRERAALFALLTLAAIGANLALVSLTIFCQARYTIYNMTLFYAALFLLARELLPAGWKRAL